MAQTRRAHRCVGGAAVIRSPQAVEAMFNGELRVFTRHDSFDEQLNRDWIAQAFHGVPVHVQWVVSSDFRKVEAVEHGFPGCELCEASGARSGLSPGIAAEGACVAR